MYTQQCHMAARSGNRPQPKIVFLSIAKNPYDVNEEFALPASKGSDWQSLEGFFISLSFIQNDKYVTRYSFSAVIKAGKTSCKSPTTA